MGQEKIGAANREEHGGKSSWGGKQCTSDTSLGRALGSHSRPGSKARAACEAQEVTCKLRKSHCLQGGGSLVGPARVGSAVVVGLCTCAAEPWFWHKSVISRGHHCEIVGKS